MSVGNASRSRRLTVVAQDPAVRQHRRILTAQLQLPYEDVENGPIGHRVHVVDFDSSTGTFYAPAALPEQDSRPTDSRILGDPAFHAQNVYALVMRTLGRFESALGRRVGWGFRAHQLKVVPHAFETANAFYSPDSESLLFGYFRRGRKPVFTCLSHDIVVHETTHALVDGLRKGFMRPSSADQAAFHEGFADIVALLSVFSMTEVIAALVDKEISPRAGAAGSARGLIHRDDVTLERLRSTVLFGLAEQMEPEYAGVRVNALRRSVSLDPDEKILELVEFGEPHRRGEVLVAAVMNAFLDVWHGRLAAFGWIEGEFLDRARVAEEGATVADQLLTMMIRALDYTPPIHLTFGEFLSAVLTADTEVRDDDSRYGLRDSLRTWFGRYGIVAAAGTADGLWPRSDLSLVRDGVRFGNLRTDATEMFRLLWANRAQLRLGASAYTRVASVRPCLRIGPEDGLPVQETIAECVQYLAVTAAELPRLGLVAPDGMPPTTDVVLEGGTTLVLDEYGTLKFEVTNRLPRVGDPDHETNLEQAQARLDYLWEQGYLDPGSSLATRLSSVHRRRALGPDDPRDEEW